MVEPIVSREFIAKNAQAQAVRQINYGAEPKNPFPAGSAAAAAWQSCFGYALENAREDVATC